MKRLFCLMICLCLLCVTAFADVAWEADNSFYKRHSRKCEPVNRVYWVNGTEGYVTAREEPDGKPLANIRNGELHHVYGTYEKDNVRWGLISFRLESAKFAGEQYLAVAEDLDHQQRYEAWVPMEDLVLRYDHQSFLEDHAGQVREVEERADFTGLLYCKYRYPGGELSWQQTGRYDHSARITLIYTDEKGNEWGYAPYFYGNSPWFCLSDPENPNLQTEDRTPDLIPEAESALLPEWMAPPNYTAFYVSAAVVVLCGITAMLLIRMMRKKE